MMNDDNIEYNLNRKNRNTYEIYLFTVMYTKPVFLEVMKLNLGLHNVKQITIFGTPGLSLQDNEKINVVDVGLSDMSEITYNYMFDYIHKNYKGKVCILLRPDVYLENQTNLEFLPFYLKNKVFLCISAVLVDEDGNMSKEEDKMKSFYSMNQDCWIFRPSEDLDFMGVDKIKFNVSRNEVRINKILDVWYNLINDTDNFKILKKGHEGDCVLRVESDIDTSGGIKLLPETMVMNKVNIENLIKYLELDDFDLYNLKTELLKKVLVKKGII